MTNTRRKEPSRLAVLQRTQRVASASVARAAATVAGVRARRAAEVERFDAELRAAETVLTVGAAAMAAVLPDLDLVAETAGLDIAQVETAVKKTDKDEVSSVLEEWRETARGTRRAAAGASTPDVPARRPSPGPGPGPGPEQDATPGAGAPGVARSMRQ